VELPRDLKTAAATTKPPPLPEGEEERADEKESDA
jgi:hypothetical protein